MTLAFSQTLKVKYSEQRGVKKNLKKNRIQLDTTISSFTIPRGWRPLLRNRFMRVLIHTVHCKILRTRLKHGYKL